MKKITLIVCGVILLTVFLYMLQNNMAGKIEKKEIPAVVSTSSQIISSKVMKLTSTAFTQNGTIPSVYTCDGSNTSPELSIADVPSGTRSLVLLMDDPDVPKNLKPDGVFDHWVMYDIDPSTEVIREGKFAGTLGVSGTGKPGYIGPCPPDREHRYFFKLYALNVKLNFPEGKTKSEIQTATLGHVIAEAELIGRYNRKK
jgi:Raf kinase inhibitor-like YbhB/YbcL family protein